MGASKVFHLFNFDLLYDLALDGFQKNLVYDLVYGLVYDLVFVLVFDLVYGWYMLGIKNDWNCLIRFFLFCYTCEKIGMACYKAFFIPLVCVIPDDTRNYFWLINGWYATWWYMCTDFLLWIDLISQSFALFV